MKLISTPIEGLIVFEPRVFQDERGIFLETYNKQSYRDIGIVAEFVQDNQSISKKNVIRGLHFQSAPFEQGKIVQVVQGKAFDVAVDLRKNSPTFGNHFSVMMSGENHIQMWIPPGFAHGFASLEENTIFCYKVSSYYHRESEGGIRFDDPDLGIAWPVSAPLISGKDLALPGLREWSSGIS